jgi:hypothetical protein
MYCRLLRFPKPQVVVYSLLVVPVIYGASKLLAATQQPGSTHSTSDAPASIACIILLPLPIILFWLYVMWSWHGFLWSTTSKGTYQRSKSSIMRAYQKPLGTSLSGATQGALAATAFAGDSLAEQRAKATLALLSNPDDNPTLIFRDKLDGEEEFIHANEPDEQGLPCFDDEQQPWGIAEAAATVRLKGASTASQAVAARALQGVTHRPGRSGTSFTSEPESNQGALQPVNGLRSSHKASGNFDHQHSRPLQEGNCFVSYLDTNLQLVNMPVACIVARGTCNLFRSSSLSQSMQLINVVCTVTGSPARTSLEPNT